MNEQTQSIARRLHEKGVETADFFRRLPADAWATPVYTDGAAWEVRQILCHFVIAERSLLLLFEDIATGGEGAPEDFDINKFNETEVARLEKVPADKLIAQYLDARAALAEFVRGLDDSDLEREGRHPWFGVDKLEKFLKLVYRHNMLHERDIRRVLEGNDE